MTCKKCHRQMKIVKQDHYSISGGKYQIVTVYQCPKCDYVDATLSS